MEKKFWIGLGFILLMIPFSVMANWRVEKGKVLQNAAGISQGNARFSVECSGAGGQYTTAFVYSSNHKNFEGYFHFEVLGSSNQLYYNDQGDVEPVVGLPGVYVLKSAEQVFTNPQKHSWFGALRDGTRLKIYEDHRLLSTFSLIGSSKAIAAVLAKCAR